MPNKIVTLLPDFLRSTLHRAAASGWAKLALVSRKYADSVAKDPTFADHHIYLLSAIPDDTLAALASLRCLESLAIIGFELSYSRTALGFLSNLTQLSLAHSRLGARDVPALTGLAALTNLNLSTNSLGDEGARALARLKNLRFLNLCSNSIGREGARALGELSNLTHLDLSINKVDCKGALGLARLAGLTCLDLHGNRIGADGARDLAALRNLRFLDLSVNRIGDEGAGALAKLQDLTVLDLSSNRIGGAGAHALAALRNLTSLDLGINHIGDEGASALAVLGNLTSLDLSHNDIGDDGATAILEAWDLRPKVLSYLDLRSENMRISGLPAEVFASSDAQAILAAYRTYREARAKGTLRPLNEAKLLVVGNEAVGKTSLVRYLIHNKPRDREEKATPRAAIHEKIDTQEWCPDKGGVHLNVWDFGGQEIMRGTHQFFLTRRSLYVIVLEDRREDDKSVYEWLKTVGARGGDSPVIVVINKSEKDPPGLRLDETSLRESYPNIVAVLRTSCDPGERAASMIAALRKTIADKVWECLPHVRDPLPLSWLRVKEAVARMAKDRKVLEKDDYVRLCEHPAEEGGPQYEPITDSDAQRGLLRILHEIGVIV